jgi:serine/threonine protein kinase
LRYISHFKIVRKIGEGGMGEVYHAKNFITGDLVALKLLHPKLTAEESNKTRFLREAKLMSELLHPNIVKIYETGEAAGRGYISMELLEGMTLSEFIKASGYLSPSIATEIALATCEALSFIHGQGVIHRDIKSENIFILQPQSKSKSRFKRLSKISQARLTWPERVRLMDFGLAKSLELMTITQVESIIGTIAYMSPEQASGRAVDQRSDVYSLGVVLYEALTGHLPHESDNELVLLQAVMDGREPKPLEAHGVEIPEPVKDIVLKMLKKYPDERFQSIEEVKEALWFVKGTVTGKHIEPVKAQPSPKSLSRQSMVYLSKGEISNAIEASKTAIENIKDISGNDEAELYFNHYKILSTAGQKGEADLYMQKAISRVITSSDLAISQSGDKQILIEYNTRKWTEYYQYALKFHQTGNISEARLHLMDAITLIKQTYLLIDDEKEKSYYTEANKVTDVIQFMNQLIN